MFARLAVAAFQCSASHVVRFFKFTLSFSGGAPCVRQVFVLVLNLSCACYLKPFFIYWRTVCAASGSCSNGSLTERSDHMDPAETHRALTNQQHMARLASSGSPCPPAAGPAATGTSAGPRDSYACDPELFNGDLDKCRGFLLQCRLVFSQRLLWFASDEAKINYIISLLRGRALVWVQASSSGMNLSSLSYDEFVERFKSISLQ